MTSLPQRLTLHTLIADACKAGARLDVACAHIGISTRTWQRWQRPTQASGDRRHTLLRTYTPPPNKLSDAERQHLLATVNSPEFKDLPPSQIVPRLADQGCYLASESTLLRLLRGAGQLTHRRAERVSPPRSKPRALVATMPNQLFSWDITYLPTLIRGVYFYLYLFLDVFSRKIVGWQVFDCERAELASQLVRDICAQEGIAPGQLTLHSDNGAPMKGATMLATLQHLGVAHSRSRPAVSNDNPYSEALFKTLKYRPQNPVQPFADLPEARLWVSTLVHWYNNEHRHSAICFVTPAQRHVGLDGELLKRRRETYELARQANPQRWAKPSRNWAYVDTVHLNPDTPDSKEK